VSNQNLASVLTDRSAHQHHSLPEVGAIHESASEQDEHEVHARTAEPTDEAAPFVQPILEMVVPRTALGRSCCSVTQLSWSRRRIPQVRPRRPHKHALLFLMFLKESSGDSSFSLVYFQMAQLHGETGRTNMGWRSAALGPEDHEKSRASTLHGEPATEFIRAQHDESQT
jgi:hypothetical protein